MKASSKFNQELILLGLWMFSQVLAKALQLERWVALLGFGANNKKLLPT
jgi:hypothetical protein